MISAFCKPRGTNSRANSSGKCYAGMINVDSLQISDHSATRPT